MIWKLEIKWSKMSMIKGKRAWVKMMLTKRKSVVFLEVEVDILFFIVNSEINSEITIK